MLQNDVRFLLFSIHDSPARPLVLGWGPSEVEPGDSVVIIHGFNLPMAIRKVQDGTYRFLGPCYVHGFMDGEAFDMASLVDEDIVFI